MIDAIYTFCIKLVYKRSQQKQHSEDTANVPLAYFNKRLQQSRRYYVSRASNGQYQVQIPDSGQKYNVDLRSTNCNCENFYYYRSLCVHAIALCKYTARDLVYFIDECYTTEALYDTYSYFLVPISLENLDTDEAVHALIVRKQQGRLKTKRIRKGAWKRKPIKCSNCGVAGDHNKRGCLNAPVGNGRRQRARDREAIETSESPDSSSSSDSESSEDSEDLIDQQFVEQARQRQRERERQEKALGSDSELSELASNVFDGIEGIEMGTLTDRLTDKQIGQQMDSVEGGSSGEVNSTVFSPRKTRSGRVR